MPPAYELKAREPFADTSRLAIPDNPYERSHGSKLTPRVAGSLLLHLAFRAGVNPYVPATAMGFLFLISGIAAGRQITGDRTVGL